MSKLSPYYRQFKLSESEYSPSELFEKFCKYQPQLVCVTQGYYGEKQTESFEKQQILYIRGHVVQTRAVATVLKGPRLILGKQISIPEDYGIVFSVLKKGKPSNKQSLSSIFANYDPPVEVAFSSKNDKHLLRHDGEQLILRLTKLYKEEFLLGHNLIEGKVTSTMQTLPLYLRDVRVSLVTGCNNFSRYEWDHFLHLLSDICTEHISIDKECGQREIALYVTDSTTDVASTVGVPTVYCSLDDCLKEERVYEKINKQKKSCPGNFDTYDIIPFHAFEKQNPLSHYNEKNTQMPPITKLGKSNKPLPLEPNKDILPINTQAGISSLSVNNEVSSERESCHQNLIPSNVMQQREYDEKIQEKAPALPLRPKQQPQTFYKSKSDCEKSIQRQLNVNEKLQQTGQNTNSQQTVAPYIYEQKLISSNIMQQRVYDQKIQQKAPALPPRPKKQPEKFYQRESDCEKTIQRQLNDGNTQKPGPDVKREHNEATGGSIKVDSLNKRHLNDYTVKEVGDVLEKLKLDKYKECFRNFLIDGLVLSEMDENVLCKECGMKKVEAIRLMVYVRQGHLAK